MVSKGVAGFCLVMVLWKPNGLKTPHLTLANGFRARNQVYHITAPSGTFWFLT